MATTAEGDPGLEDRVAAPPRKSGSWRGCLLVALVVPVICGAGIAWYGMGFLALGRRGPQIGREVRAKLKPGVSLHDALALAAAAGRNEPATSMGSPIALVWAHCTREGWSGNAPVAAELAGDTRVFLFMAPRGPESPEPVPAGRLPATLDLGQPGANPTDRDAVVEWLGRCPEVEIVFESGFFGWVRLPLKVTQGRVESIGEVQTRAK